jgi:molybdenum cofactor biosynthesis protein B
VVTVSGSRRGVADTGGARLAAALERGGHRVVARAWVGDDATTIRRAVRALLRRRDLDAVVLTGGTGPARRDVTPEALSPLLDRMLPGFGELFRLRSLAQVGAAAWLSRAGAGLARGRLVAWLPGSPRAAVLAARELLVPVLGHVAGLLHATPNPDED